MEKHNPFLSGSDEDLIQAMEFLLEQKDVDWDTIHDILDELDHRSGASPFDLNEGWTDLQNRWANGSQKHSHSFHRYPITLIAVLICLALAVTALAVNLGLHQKFISLFHINEENQSLIVDSVDTPDCSVSHNGVTITVTQTIADTAGCYVIYEVTLPETIALPDDATPSTAILLPPLDFLNDDPNHSAGSGDYKLLERDAHHWTCLITSESNSDSVTEGIIRLMFINFGYKTADGRHISLVDEPITLQWPLKQSSQVITRTPDFPITVGNTQGNISKLSLSPISLSVFTSDVSIDSQPISLIFQDGSTLLLSESTSSMSSIYTAPSRCSFHYRFYDLIDPDTVEKIVIGTIEIPL